MTPGAFPDSDTIDPTATDHRGKSGACAGGDPAPGDAACTLNVALLNSRGALARITATLSSVPVLALTYRTSGCCQATAEIRLPKAHAARARNRLNRMVDVLHISDPAPVTAPNSADPTTHGSRSDSSVVGVQES